MTTKKKIIQIKVKGSNEMPLKQLQKFQGKLKYLPDENSKKLKISILKNGFRIPIFVWGRKVLDGHQRLAVLQEFQKEGYEVPPIPVYELQAESEQDAKKLVLLLNSRYGVIREEGFYEFAGDFDLNELSTEIHIPELNLEELDEDSSRKIKNIYKVEIQCLTEEEMKTTYKELKEKGYKCRILISKGKYKEEPVVD